MDSASGSKKRKATGNVDGNAKKPKAAAKATGKGKKKDETEGWPEYFVSLFKTLNTVLTFCAARKANTTFSAIRKSVEDILKRPLELEKVAEIKALLPTLVDFAYIPQHDSRINGIVNKAARLSQVVPVPDRRGRSPDFFLPDVGPSKHRDDSVLVLQFKVASKTSELDKFGLVLPPISTLELQKNIERRNKSFTKAVSELLAATPPEEDAVAILQASGRDRLPVNGDNSKDTFKDNIRGPVPEPNERNPVDYILEELESATWYQSQMVHRRTVEDKPGQIATLEPPLSPAVSHAFETSRGITSLYTHQVAAISAIRQGCHVIVSTSTASGKSVIYQAPVLSFLEEDPAATAIFVYPTKALAQDQRAALEQLLAACPGLEHIKVATYDGDTPQDCRRDIRETASVIFTNFDMIHAAILPHEELWRRVLQNLKLVAVDELHYYHNLFGSHVAQILRRFRRVCVAVRNPNVEFVSCSATISQPQQHMRNMFGVEDVEVVIEDGAPTGQKDYVVWDPGYIDGAQSKHRVGALGDATGLMRFLMKRGIRVILFCKVGRSTTKFERIGRFAEHILKVRKTCELAMKTIRAELSAEGRQDVLERVMPYRGGYSQEDRRRIEAEAFSGQLLGIIATNALELGVDIGTLDAVIMLGFPGSIPSFRQQAGRAGRRARDALAILVADGSPIDMHYVSHPEELFEKSTGELVIDLESPVIIEAHLQCAGQEMPLSLTDEVYFGPLMKDICDTRLSKDKEGWYHPHPKYLPTPSKFIAIRGASEDTYTAIDITNVGKPSGSARILEELEESRALFELYEGAVFIHQGLTFIVKEVYHDGKIAKLIRAKVNWTTSPRDKTTVAPTQTLRIRAIVGSQYYVFYGPVHLQTQVFGYWKIRGKELLDKIDMDTERWERDSTGMWLDIPKSALDALSADEVNPHEAIHSAQHAVLNRFAMRADLRMDCRPAPKDDDDDPIPELERPGRLIFYDAVGKNGGVAAKAFDHSSDLLRKALDVVDACECEDGCTQCIWSNNNCKHGNETSSKSGALVVLRSFLGAEEDFSVPAEDEPMIVLPGGVVLAESVPLAPGVQLEQCGL